MILANVGDSRCILGSSKPEISPPVDTKPLQATARQNIDYFHQTRVIPSASPVYSVQLAYDQRPNDPEELVRFFKHGSRVLQTVDLSGRKTGPYRVYGVGKGPGLTVSRLLGNTEGGRLGVISEPILTEYNLKPQDKFIVLGTRALWEVMTNDDVCAFVEKYRHYCARDRVQQNSEVTCLNATIAQLLCEEARLRLVLCGAAEIASEVTCVVVELEYGEAAMKLCIPTEDSDYTVATKTTPRSNK